MVSHLPNLNVPNKNSSHKSSTAYTNRDKTTNDQYGDELRDHFLKNEPIPNKEDEYKIMKQLVEMPALNYQVVNEYAKELISDKDSNLVAYIFAQDKPGKVDITEAQMAQAIKEVTCRKTFAIR